MGEGDGVALPVPTKIPPLGVVVPFPFRPLPNAT